MSPPACHYQKKSPVCPVSRVCPVCFVVKCVSFDLCLTCPAGYVCLLQVEMQDTSGHLWTFSLPFHTLPWFLYFSFS